MPQPVEEYVHRVIEAFADAGKGKAKGGMSKGEYMQQVLEEATREAILSAHDAAADEFADLIVEVIGDKWRHEEALARIGQAVVEGIEPDPLLLSVARMQQEIAGELIRVCEAVKWVGREEEEEQTEPSDRDAPDTGQGD